MNKFLSISLAAFCFGLAGFFIAYVMFTETNGVAFLLGGAIFFVIVGLYSLLGKD